MLPARHRMRSRDDFVATTRRGRRSGRPTVVVHLLTPPAAQSPAAATRVGFVVGRSVGGSVVRHRVSRRLRALAAARIDRVPVGSRLVVRALPASAGADSAALGADLDAALAAVTAAPRRDVRRSRPVGPA